MSTPAIRAISSTLPLLVPGVGADHPDATVPPDDPAFLAHLLGGRTHLHGSCTPNRSCSPADAGKSRAGRLATGEHSVVAGSEPWLTSDSFGHRRSRKDQ